MNASLIVLELAVVILGLVVLVQDWFTPAKDRRTLGYGAVLGVAVVLLYSFFAFDGRETAPAAADEKLFLGADGKPLPFYEGVVGGRSVGVPGTVRMLEMAHKQYGKLPWAQLIQPANAEGLAVAGQGQPRRGCRYFLFNSRPD